MKIKFPLLISIGLLMSALLYIGCCSPANQNPALKTKDDFTNSMKQCSQFAHDHHMNSDSAVKVCFPPGNGCIQLGDPPPVVILNDTLYIYIGQGTDTVNTKKDTTYYPLWLANNGGQVPNQVKLRYVTNSPNGTTVNHNTYFAVGPTLSVMAYDYRIAIPLNQYNNPKPNSRINMTGPNLTSGTGSGQR